MEAAVKAVNVLDREREMDMAGETDAARQALQDLARHNDPTVKGWFAAAGVSPRDLTRPMTARQLMGFLHFEALQALATGLEGEAPIADDALSSLGRAVTAVRQIQLFTSVEQRDVIGAGLSDAEWRRAMFSIEFHLGQHEVTRLEQEGHADQVTPDMLKTLRGLAGDLGAEKAQLARAFVYNVAARNLRRDPEFADLMRQAELDLAEVASDADERAHWTWKALTSLCSVAVQRMPDGSMPPSWGGPAAATRAQAHHARRLIEISRDAVAATADAAQRLWYTKVAVTAAQAASGGDPSLLQQVADFPVSPRESAALSLAGLAGMRRNARLDSGVGPPDELRRAAHAIGSSRVPVAGKELAAGELLTTTWSRVSRGSMDLSIRGQRYYMPSNDTAAVSAAMAGLYRDPHSWQHPEEAMSALADASKYLIESDWAEQVARVAIDQHVRLDDADTAVTLADSLGEIAASSSSSPRLPAEIGVALVDAASSREAYASGLLERAVDALAERDGARWIGGGRVAITDAWVRARALEALCSRALASRASDPDRAENTLKHIAGVAEADTQYQNQAVKAAGSLAALAVGDVDQARRLAHSPIGIGTDPERSLVPDYIKQAIAASDAPAPALPDGEAAAPSPWQVAGQALTGRLAGLDVPSPLDLDAVRHRGAGSRRTSGSATAKTSRMPGRRAGTERGRDRS